MSSLPQKDASPESFDAGGQSMTREEILLIIRRYEAQYGISSEEFLRRWKEGTFEDSFETNSWAILLDYV